MVRKAAIGSVCALAVSSCGFFGQPNVGCNEESTKGLVQQALEEEVESQLKDPRITVGLADVMKGITISIDAVRADSFDEKINKHSCKADMSITLPAAVAPQFESNPILKNLLEQEGVSVTPSGVKGPVQYTSQSADDGEKHYVEVVGHKPLAMSVASAALMGAFNPAAPVVAKQQGEPAVGTTIVGTIDAGTMMSNVVTESGDSFSFETESPAGNTIFAACQMGDRCSVTGKINGDSIESVSAAKLL